MPPKLAIPGGTALRSSWAARLALVAGFGLFLRVLYVLIVAPSIELGFDSIWYGFQAEAIASGVGYVDVEYFFREGREVAVAGFPPLWPALLAVVNRLGGESERTYELVGAGLGTATIVLAGLVGRRVAGATSGIVAAVLVATSVSLIAVDGSLMSESLFVLLLTGSVLLAYRARDQPTTACFITLGTVLGVAALARSDALFLAPILVVAVAWRVTGSLRRRSALVALALGAFVLVLVPWTVRNTISLGEVVVLSSNSGSLLEGANCDATYGGDGLGLWDPTCLHFTRRPGLSEAESTRRARTRAVEYARDHVDRLPLVASVRALRLWGLYEPVTQARAEAIESRNEAWQVAAWGQWIVSLPFAVFGFVTLRRRGADLAPVLGLVIGVTVVAVLSWGNQRFRAAAEPAVLVLAAAGLVEAGRRARRRFA